MTQKILNDVKSTEVLFFHHIFIVIFLNNYTQMMYSLHKWCLIKNIKIYIFLNYAKNVKLIVLKILIHFPYTLNLYNYFTYLRMSEIIKNIKIIKKRLTHFYKNIAYKDAKI